MGPMSNFDVWLTTDRMAEAADAEADAFGRWVEEVHPLLVDDPDALLALWKGEWRDLQEAIAAAAEAEIEAAYRSEMEVAVAMVWHLDRPFDARLHRASKEHGMCRICRKPVEAGQYYVRSVMYAPWVLIADDVDDEGRPTGGPAGEWGVSKDHAECLIESNREEWWAV